MELRGCYTAITTPFNASGIDEAAMAAHASWMVDHGVAGLVVCGTTGESATMSEAEKLRAMDIVCDAVGDRATVIGGAGNNSTSESLEFLALVCERTRVDAVMSVTPYYLKPTQAGCVAHFNTLASASTKPLIAYNVPGRTGVNLTVDTMLAIAAHSNVVGIKEASGDMFQGTQLLSRLDRRVALLSGDDATSGLLAFAGAQGVISVVSNIAPAFMSDMIAAIHNSNLETGRALHQKVTELHRIVFEQSNPIPIKGLVAKLGFGSGDLRLPLLPMNEADLQRLWNECQKLGVSR